WLSDVSGVFGRKRAPVAQLARVLKPGEAAFVFNGVVPNLKGQPLVDEWPVVVFSKHHFARVETIQDFLSRTGIGTIDSPNLGTTSLDHLHDLLEDAVSRAQTFVHETRKRFQSAMDDDLLRLDERLRRLRARHGRTIASLFDHLDHSALHQSRRKRQEARIEETFAAWWDWIEKTRQTADDPNPYVRLVAVFRG